MQKRFLFCALALVMVLAVVAGCAKAPEEPLVIQDQLPVISQGDGVQGDEVAAQAPETPAERTLRTTLYYLDQTGYTVPVTRSIPWQEGIAKAALNWLIGEQTDSVLTAKGLKNPLPAGTTVDLDIAQGKAKVDVKLPEGGFVNQAQEAGALAAMVNTLLEFPTVESVSFVFNGKAVTQLPHGTAVEASYAKPLVNSQPKGTPSTAEGKTELYYTNVQGQVLVPVFRALDSATPTAAVKKLLDPGVESGLMSLLPEGCEILGVTAAQDGTMQVNLSGGFDALSDTPSMQTMAIKAITLTCMQFDGVEEVDILVEGAPLEAGVATMAGLDGINSYE